MSHGSLAGKATFLLGDARDVLATIPDGSVDLVLTSPPFLALRSYLPPDHPDKDREIGAEPTPSAFTDTLLGLSADWRRVLAPHGSIAVELGDTYSGSGGAGGDYADGGLREGQQAFSGSAAKRAANGVGDDYRPARSGRTDGWPLAKSLCLIPELYRIGLVYGLNPLTGQPSPAGEWRARNVVRWCRPNPPVGSLGDKVRPATSDMVIACVSGKRWFDLDAVRSPAKYGVEDDQRATMAGTYDPPGQPERRTRKLGENGGRLNSNENGAPPLDHWWFDDAYDQDAWLVSTQPYRGSHYATWPEALLVNPILSMCPLRVCRECGEPSRRIVERNRISEADDSTRVKTDDLPEGRMDRPPEVGWEYERKTLGWSDCGHDAWRPGVVLDPFTGSGTTMKVATEHGRDAIGIDFDERNLGLAIERAGWDRLSARHLDGSVIDLASVPKPATPMAKRVAAEVEALAAPITFD